MEWKSKWVVMISGIRVVRRVLDRAEILGLVIVRYDDHAARMLPGRSFDAGTADRQAVDFGVFRTNPRSSAYFLT